MKYIVGYYNEKARFIILYETNNSRLALLIANKYRATRKDDIKVVKRA